MSTVTAHAPRTRRNTELALVLLALATSVGAYALVSAGATGSWPDRLWHVGALAAIVLGLHVVLRLRAPYADPTLLPVATVLNGLGLAMIHRIDLAEMATDPGRAAGAPRQLVWSFLGVLLAAAVLVLLHDHRVLRRYTWTAMVAGLVLLVLPLTPGLGARINGAQIWIQVGPLSFQPGELAKIVLTVFFAGYLVSQRDNLSLAGRRVLGLRLPRLRDLGPIVVAWGASVVVLVLERDLGTSLLFFGLFVAMLYVATERVGWIVLGLLMFVAGAFVAAQVFPHVMGRVDAWLHPFDPEVYGARFGSSYQLVQARFGMADGGLLGTGLGQGSPQIVPYAESDFIFASLGEEIGLAGVFAVLALYMILVERGLRTAIGVRDGFGKLLAAGLSFTVALQCFVVVGGVTGVIPLTGLTLPLMAAGGSSLVSNWVIVGILLRISDSARRPAPVVPPEPDAGATQVVGVVGAAAERGGGS